MLTTNATRESAKQNASTQVVAHRESAVVTLLTIALMLSTGSNPIKGPRLACMLANLVSRSSWYSCWLEEISRLLNSRASLHTSMKSLMSGRSEKKSAGQMMMLPMNIWHLGHVTMSWSSVNPPQSLVNQFKTDAWCVLLCILRWCHNYVYENVVVRCVQPKWLDDCAKHILSIRICT